MQVQNEIRKRWWIEKQKIVETACIDIAQDLSSAQQPSGIKPGRGDANQFFHPIRIPRGELRPNPGPDRQADDVSARDPFSIE